MPPVPAPAATAPAPKPAGSRIRRGYVFIAMGVLLAVVAGLAALGALIGGPEERKPQCPDKTEPCASPPRVELLTLGGVYRSPELGFRLQFPDDGFKIGSRDGRSVRLDYVKPENRPDLENFGITLTFRAVPADEASPRSLFDRELDDLKKRAFGLAEDNDAEFKILGPELALQRAIGNNYTATIDSPQGVGVPVHMAVLAAGDGDTTLTATLAISDSNTERRDFALQFADLVMDTVRLRSAPA